MTDTDTKGRLDGLNESGKVRTPSDLLLEVMRLIVNDETSEKILECARRVKQQLSSEMCDAMQACSFLDNLVSIFGLDPQWQYGMLKADKK